MKTITTLIHTELKRLTSTPLGILAFVALMIVPLLYGGLYLWGNQSPYARLNQIPAGIVVADRGSTLDGKHVNQGQEIAKRMIKGKTFAWRELSAAEAKRAIRNGQVDFVVTFPASFSHDLASVSKTSPTQAKLQLATDDANSYLSTTIAKSAATTIRDSVAQQVGQKAAKTFLVSFSDLRGKLVTASDGASKLASGSKQAHSGTATLASGTKSLASGLGTLSSGAAKVASGASTAERQTKQLAAGTSTLATKSAALATGTATLAEKSALLATGTSTLAEKSALLASSTAAAASGASKLASALTQIDEGSTSTAAALAALLKSDGLSDAQIASALAVLEPGSTAVHSAATSASTLSDGVSALATGTTTLTTKLDSAATGATTLATKLDSAATGAHQLATGAATIADKVHSGLSGAHQLATGATKVASGASTAATGATKLETGSAKLESGLVKIVNGADSLHTGLASGVTKIPATTAAERTTQSKGLSNPVSVAHTALTDAGSYGAGLAPFFLSLSAWIGMYALFLSIRPLSRRAITAVNRPIRAALAGWLTPGLLGVLQVAGLYLIITVVLGFKVVHPFAMFTVLAVAVLTFSAILQLLNAVLGSVGQFFGLILMLLQLVVAGGTFPWQTLPAPLAVLHHALPMSYAVDGIRQTMYGGSMSLALGDLGVLGIWLVGCVALTAITARRMNRYRTVQDLRPSLIGG